VGACQVRSRVELHRQSAEHRTVMEDEVEEVVVPYARFDVPCRECCALGAYRSAAERVLAQRLRRQVQVLPLPFASMLGLSARGHGLQMVQMK